MASTFQDKIATGVEQYLEPGEQVLAAMSSALQGSAQVATGNIILQETAGKKIRRSRAAAAAANVTLPESGTIGLVLTDRRLLFVGLGIGATVKQLGSAVALKDVGSISVKRTGLAGVTTVVVRGEEITFEGRVAPGKELEAALASTR